MFVNCSICLRKKIRLNNENVFFKYEAKTIVDVDESNGVLDLGRGLLCVYKDIVEVLE